MFRASVLLDQWPYNYPDVEIRRRTVGQNSSLPLLLQNHNEMLTMASFPIRTMIHVCRGKNFEHIHVTASSSY